MTDPTIQVLGDDRYPATSLDGRDDQPSAGSPAVLVPGTTELIPGGVQSAGEHRSPRQRAVDGRRRSRRAFGTVERLPSGRFRARVIGPQGRYVSAPATFANRTDAAAVGGSPARRPGSWNVSGAGQAGRIALGGRLRGAVDRGAPHRTGVDEGALSRTPAHLHRAHRGPLRCRVLVARGGAALAPPAGGASRGGRRTSASRATRQG
jgi:hypothetical protein